MTISVLELFKIGIGPSSSHTVGPMRAAKQFVDSLLQSGVLNEVTRVKAEMFGSLGATGKGHGTPKAVLLGLQGKMPETVDIDTIDKNITHILSSGSLTILNTHLVDFCEKTDLILHRRKTLPFHSNGMYFTAYDDETNVVSRQAYYSVGGGFVVDDPLEEENSVNEDIRKLKYPFESAADLLKICDKHSINISDIVRENELSWRDNESTESEILNIWSVMQECVRNGCRNDGELPGGLHVQRRASILYQKLKTSPPRYDADFNLAMDWVSLYALAVNEENASGGRVVTAPTNGAAGIIPAVLHYYMNFISGANEKGAVNFILTAAAIGMLYKKNASISGAEVGCQGEVGSACSMAAGALVEVLGGTPKQVENAAEIAMEHNLGLTCDPIGGLVQIPCIERNAVASIKSIHAANLALKGDGSHFVSLDKVIHTMRDTGRDMKTKYKETSRGGLAVDIIEVPVSIVEC